jgi:hypothetical protein
MMTKIKRLTDAYKFLGFCPEEGIQGVFGDSHAVVIRLHRQKKDGMRNLSVTTQIIL